MPANVAASSADRAPGTFVAGSLEGGLDDGGGELRVVDADGTVRGAAVLAALGPVEPAPVTGLVVEASADQVETLAARGAGVSLTVAVANRGPGAATGVVLAGTGTTCGRSLGTIAAGRSIVLRCSTAAAAPLDRSYRFRATAGGVTVASNRVDVRRIQHRTSYWSQSLPNAPTAGAVVLGPAGTIEAPVTLAAPTAPADPTIPPVRWLVASAFEPGRGVPTQGAVVRPSASSTLVPLAVGVPVRLGFAARNAAGTGARSPLTPFLTPRSTVTWPHASAAELVDAVFVAVDGRAPTAAERGAAVASIEAGDSPSTLIEQRLATGRWPTQVEPLVRLYIAYLGRPPDASGLRYWIARRAEGRSLDRISASFAGSPEFRRATGGLSDDAFVRFVYTSVLHRAADPGGLAYWRGRLGAGWSRGRVMTSFSESGEGRRELAPQVRPTVAAVALLGAPPTASDLAPAADWLRAGGAFATVLEGIRSSDAYGARHP